MKDSPLLSTSDPAWRQDVQDIWTCLHHHYKISQSDSGDHYIFVSCTPKLTLRDFGQIAQALIHFEPTLELLVPNRSTVKRNWRDGDKFGKENRSRPQSIAAIEDFVSRLEESNPRHWEQLRAFLTPSAPQDPGEWVWNLLSGSERGMDIRRVATVPRAGDAVNWPEFVLSFVQASIACKSPQQLQSFECSPEGLRCFLSGTGPKWS